MDQTMGLRLYTIGLVVNTWSGAYAGIGNKVQVVTSLDAGSKHRITQISQRDVIASGGLYQDGDVRVGPLTPTYTMNGGGGMDPTAFDPPAVGPNTEVMFLVTGPGMLTGSYWKKVGQTLFPSTTSYYVVLRKTGETGA